MAPLCSFPGCGRLVQARGLCAGHYQQQRRGQVLRPLRHRRVCTVAGCGQPHYAKGLCGKHYQRLRRLGVREPAPRVVVPCACGAVAIKRDRCARCYQRWYYHARLKLRT